MTIKTALSRKLFPSTFRACPSPTNLRWPPWRGSSSLVDSLSGQAQGNTRFANRDDQDVFSYNAGRWLWNEKNQLSRRYVQFDLAELARKAAGAVQSRSCVAIEKLTEGNFNKAFLMTMDDGKEAIARIPNPNAGRPHFTTASEVATMMFVQEVLNIPAPKVYTWDSTINNAVGAEFIIMERAKGVELSKVWDSLSGLEKYQLVKSIVQFEKRFASVDFPMYGSIYLVEDIPGVSPDQIIHFDPSNEPSGRVFAVGPTTNRAFFDKGRASANTCQGPWRNMEQFLRARIERELACIERFTVFPRQQGFFGGPNQYQPSAAYKRKVLLEYSRVVDLLRPKVETVSRPVLWHSDLHTDNVFVNPLSPTEITAIIDWQASNLSPLFMQAGHPSLVEFEGPIPENFQIKLPSDFDALNSDQQVEARKLRAAQSLYKLYEIELMRECDSITRAMQYKSTLECQIIGLSGSIFSDGEVILEGWLMQLQDDWNRIMGHDVLCPLNFTQQERDFQSEQENKWKAGVELMHRILEEVGAYQDWDGWVNHKTHDMMKHRLAQVCQNFLTRHATTEEEELQWMRAWPFTDRERPL